MVDGKKCEGCRQRHNCRDIYGKLGAAAGPSVAWRAVIAFLLPILVFVAFLAGVERIASYYTNRSELQTGVGLFTAVAATFLWIFVARAIAGRPSHN